VKNNVSQNNPIGSVDLGPPPVAGDPLPYTALPSVGNAEHYGADAGGCVTYGDIKFSGNYWQEPPYAQEVAIYNAEVQAILGFAPWSSDGFFDVCPRTNTAGVSYPVNLSFTENQIMQGQPGAGAIMSKAGALVRPEGIPEGRWTLP